jgi:hypothetical protein
VFGKAGFRFVKGSIFIEHQASHRQQLRLRQLVFGNSLRYDGSAARPTASATLAKVTSWISAIMHTSC